MAKRMISKKSMLELKISRLERIIETLKSEIPLEGKKWQSGMIRHYTSQLDELRASQQGSFEGGGWY